MHPRKHHTTCSSEMIQIPQTVFLDILLRILCSKEFSPLLSCGGAAEP